LYVDKIELYGFKSFANRTEIPLARGVTAIVGPNGCGKSNISDAFRWALGEQNVRTLRGEKLEDVIFKGSGQAKAMGLAEVVLTVHNDDGALPIEYSQVAIARRVYRSGESEFLINKVACRLKDIKDLFLGTGLVSGGYSMIERDMIDQVLSDKDDARRLLFEEAAGVSRYKLRRRESQRKLEGVETDLIRIEDALREISRAVRSLSRQAGKVRRHRRLKDELDRLEILQAHDRWQTLRREALSSEAAHRRREAEVTDLRSHLAVLEARRENERQGWLDLGEAVEEALRAFEQTNRRVSAAEQEAQVLTTRNESWAREEKDLTRERERHEDRLSEVSSELIASAPAGEELEGRVTAARGEAEAALALRVQAERALREVRGELQSAQQLNLDLTTRHSESKKELESVELRRRASVAREAALAGHAEGFAERETQIRIDLTSAEEKESHFAAELTQLVGARTEQRDARGTAQREREARRGSLAQVNQRRAQLQSRLELLEEQRTRHAGFDSAVRHLLEARHELPGLIGVVGEMVRLREGRETEGRAVLGDTVPWVLVKDDAAAIDMIHRLRAVGLGGVTFFPVESAGMEGGVAEDPVEEARIHELFATEGAGATFVHYLARRTRLCASLEAALASAQRRPESRWVTRDGEVAERGGTLVLSGGRPGEEEILRRAQEIPSLQDQLAEVRAEIRRLEDEETVYAAAVEAAVRALETIEGRQSEAERNRQSAAMECGRLRTESAMLREEHERLEQERAQLAEEIRLLVEDDHRLRGLVAERGESSVDAQTRFEGLRVRGESVEEEKDARTREAAQHEMRVLRLEADLSAHRSRRTALEREEAERTQALAELVARRAEREAEATAAVERIAILSEQLVSDRAAREGCEVELTGRRERHLAVQDAMARMDDEAKGVRTRLDAATTAMHHDDVGRVQTEGEAEQVRRRVLEEFGVDLADSAALPGALVAAGGYDEWVDPADSDDESGEGVALAPDASETTEPEPVMNAAASAALADPEARGVRIVELRRRVTEMGSLNFLAEEEYSREKERLDFHEKHATDLRTARADLLEAIRQINEKASVMFEETFSQVQANFLETYQQLFPGGEASIRLGSGDPLEGDIEIAARPKGKKLESIRLLSSGERALTAIALLFAIYLAKPSPVCLLDEVDAPLDDANLDRFLALLRHFSERTQFIMITHNKKTMAMAGRLFGVTMEEPGVSKIVSVRLNEGTDEILRAPAERAPAERETAEPFAPTATPAGTA